ncbi:hypothetical protein [Peribacillus frigoritolerans]|uniref:hypothetical protein n=1 Tax=Peribacillus frigoritolerans TaxID=450367 RepID=UPI003017C80A
MLLPDSKILLHDAKRLLDEINHLYSDAIHAEEIPPILRVRVKQFLDNVNASLEFAAFEIFNTYCSEQVKQIKRKPKDFERHENSIYFPVWDSKTAFDNYIDTKFVSLRNEQPDIVAILQKYQPFPTRPKWLRTLKDLVNTNKHRNLSKQSQRHVTHIKNLEIHNGEIKNFEGSTEQYISFDDIDQPVLKTLKRIFASAPTVIEDLEKIL